MLPLASRILGIGACALSVGCIGPGFDPVGSSDGSSAAFSLANTTGRGGSLLRGLGLKAISVPGSDGALRRGTAYFFEVRNDDTGEVLSSGEVRTDDEGMVAPAGVLFDAGQEEEVEEGDNVRVTVTDEESGEEQEEVIGVGPEEDPGWQVEEVEPPEVWAADGGGDPANAFAVGGADRSEVVGPVHVAGRGFPTALSGGVVDVYVVEARPDWLDQDIPQTGETGHVLGPIPVELDADSDLPATDIGFDPGTEAVGIYDILVDVDRAGRMAWSLVMKDGGDGIGEQVGFTVQYSAAWFRSIGERHILVNMAYRQTGYVGSGEFANSYADGEEIWAWLNPPVMYEHHFSATKWIVYHQDFDQFWNNPDLEREAYGCVPFEQHAVQELTVPVQRGCTNSYPTTLGPIRAATPPGETEPVTAFDIVFDRDGDGCYQPGVDLLDVVGGAVTHGDLVTAEEFAALPREDRVGLRIVR